LATKIALAANFKATLDLNKRNPIMRRNQIANVLAVRDDHQIAWPVGLSEKTLDRLRQPLPTIAGQTKTGHETEAAHPPLGLRRSPSFRKARPEGPSDAQGRGEADRGQSRRVR